MLVTTCIFTPIKLAFIEEDYSKVSVWIVIEYFIDFSFLIDIILNFFTAFYVDEFIIEDNRSVIDYLIYFQVIIRNYLTSWFLIDLIAIVPFDVFIKQGDNVNRLSRFFRIGRLYRMIKMTRLIRMLKIIKDRKKFEKFLQLSKYRGGIERLFFMILIFGIMCHIVACLW